jgi:hypothetical protein
LLQLKNETLRRNWRLEKNRKATCLLLPKNERLCSLERIRKSTYLLLLKNEILKRNWRLEKNRQPTCLLLLKNKRLES